MRAWQYSTYGTPQDVLHLRENVSVPVPGAGEVLIKVAATTLNPVDYKIMTGSFARYVPSLLGGPPFSASGTTPCSDGSGTVEAMGAGCAGYNVGDRVCFDAAGRGGALAQYVVVPAINCFVVPPDVSMIQAAAGCGIAMGTAIQGCRWMVQLLEDYHLPPVEVPALHFLVLGASGGVGSAAVVYLKSLGYRVTATASERTRSFVESLGADRIIDYKSQNWWEVLEPNSIHGIYQAVYSHSNYEHSASVLVPGRSCFCTCDATEVSSISAGLFDLVKRKVTGHCPYYSFIYQISPEILKEAATLMSSGKCPNLAPGRPFSFAEAKEAFALLMSHGAIGKIIVESVKLDD